MPDFIELARHALEGQSTRHLLRRRQVVHKVVDRTNHRSANPVELEIGGCRYVHFAGNDYLGLACEFAELASLHSQGSGAAALIAGQSPELESAERAIAAWKCAGGCVVLPSGYQANVAAVQAVAAVIEAAGSKIRFLFDKLIHASLIDAIRCTGASFRVYPHHDYDKLQRLLQDTHPDTHNVVLAESVFSMDGDLVDLVRIVEMKRRLGFTLILDEAHASGVIGPRGAGLAAELGVAEAVDLGIVTLSKAVGVSGGAVYGRHDAIEAVVNFGRAYVYTTAVSPHHATLIERAVGRVVAADAARQQLRHHIARLNARLPRLNAVTPIVPVVLGEESRAIAAHERLKSQGLFVPVVRPPTVPRGSSRLRVTLCSAHTSDHLHQLIDALSALF